MQSHRQPRLGDAAGNRSGRLLCQVERIAEGRPVDPAGLAGRKLEADIERRDRERRRYQQVVVAVEKIHVRAERAALHLRIEDLGGADVRALFGDLDQTGIDQLAHLRRERLQERRGAGEPLRAEDAFRIFEARVLLLDFGAEVGEYMHRLAHDRRDFRIDAGVAQIGRVRNAQIGHALVERAAPVARLVGQRIPVARVGQRKHVQHQRRVGDAARHRADVCHGAEGRERPRRHSAE